MDPTDGVRVAAEPGRVMVPVKINRVASAHAIERRRAVYIVASTAFGFCTAADNDGTGVVFSTKCAAISWRLRILSSKAAEAPKAMAPSTHTREKT